MTENENPAPMIPYQSDLEKRRVNALSTTALFLALVGVFCAIVSMSISAKSVPAALLIVVGLLSLLLWLISLIFGFVVLVRIKESRCALIGLLISGFLLVTFGMPTINHARPMAYRLVCGTNLSGLGKAIRAYAHDHNDLLPSSRWCDTLIKYEDVSPNTFVCKSSFTPEGQSSYAINKNLLDRSLKEIDPNTVMLFETFHGWNQVGRAETLSIQNHEGKGCNIIFVDGSVRFVLTEDISKLRWQP